MTSRERDSQRSKVYAAERAWRADTDDQLDLAGVRAYVRDVRERGYQQRHLVVGSAWARNPIAVGDGRGRSRGGADDDGIYMPRNARRETVILHELAHVIQIRTNGWGPAAHGWQFAAIMLDLVADRMGPDAESRLRAEYRAHRVRWTAPRTQARRHLDPATRARNTARLAAANAERQLDAAVRRAMLAEIAEARAAHVAAGAVLIEWDERLYVVDRATTRSIMTSPTPQDWGLSKSPRQALLYPTPDAARAHWAEHTDGAPWPAVLRIRRAAEVIDQYERLLAARRTA